MNIKNLTLQEIGEKIKKFLPPFLNNDFQFQESYQLEFEEVRHNIPKKYHKFFNDSDMINSASGIIENDKFEDDYIVILVSSQDYSQALFLFLQSENKSTGEVKTELLTAFILANIEK